MRVGTIALQVARILVLLFLLRATGWFDDAIHQAQTRLQMGELWGPWAAMSLVSLLFVGVLLVGRRHWHPWVVLAIEAVVACVLAFVPPVQWVIWLGIGRWAAALAGGSVQPLAAAWLGVVALRGFHQLRDGDVAPPRTPGGGGGVAPSTGPGDRYVSSE